MLINYTFVWVWVCVCVRVYEAVRQLTSIPYINLCTSPSMIAMHFDQFFLLLIETIRHVWIVVRRKNISFSLFICSSCWLSLCSAFFVALLIEWMRCFANTYTFSDIDQSIDSFRYTYICLVITFCSFLLLCTALHHFASRCDCGLAGQAYALTRFNRYIPTHYRKRMRDERSEIAGIPCIRRVCSCVVETRTTHTSFG